MITYNEEQHYSVGFQEVKNLLRNSRNRQRIMAWFVANSDAGIKVHSKTKINILAASVGDYKKDLLSLAKENVFTVGEWEKIGEISQFYEKTINKFLVS